MCPGKKLFPVNKGWYWSTLISIERTFIRLEDIFIEFKLCVACNTNNKKVGSALGSSDFYVVKKWFIEW